MAFADGWVSFWYLEALKLFGALQLTMLLMWPKNSVSDDREVCEVREFDLDLRGLSSVQSLPEPGGGIHDRVRPRWDTPIRGKIAQQV